MTGGQTGSGLPRLVVVPTDTVEPAAAPHKPAIFPLAPRFERHEVCVIVRDGTIKIIARDVLEALGREAGEYSSDPGHDTTPDPDWKYSRHAAATAWPHSLIVDIFNDIAEHDDRVFRFLHWLDERLGELIAVGVDTVERRVVHGTGQRREPGADEPATGPAFYSVAATAKILSRDPSIGAIGRDALFELLNKWSWIHRVGTAWRPEPTLLTAGVLAQQDVHVTQYSKSEPYPQVLITPLGIEALHSKLGGTATLDLSNASHLTLI